MSKCVKCGNEILTGDIHWEMGLCNNCYNELYKDHKTHISLDKMWLELAQRFRDENEKLQDKTADLEAKLTESEKQIKDAREAGNMAVDSWCKNRRKYEAQIAEMQNKSFILYSMLYETLEKQGCENVASQIDQMTGWTYDKEADWLKGNRNYDQLKQQLAEKDAERELDNSFWKQECDSLQKTLVEKDKENNELEFIVEEIEQFAWEQLNNDNFDKYKAYDEMYTKIKQLTKNSPYEKQHQDKISFTIEQLEKVKSAFGLINSKLDKVETIKEYIHYIEHQIKQLKEMK